MTVRRCSELRMKRDARVISLNDGPARPAVWRDELDVLLGQGPKNTWVPPAKTGTDGTSAYPLTPAQEAIWSREHSRTSRIPCANIAVGRLRGVFDRAALKQSLSGILSRHSALRTSFATTDGRVLQTVRASQAVPINVHHLTDGTELTRHSECQRFIQSCRRTPFDLSQGPLLRADVLKLNDNEHVIIVAAARIVADEWSMTIVMNELVQRYQAITMGGPSFLGAAPPGYADFVAWERQVLDSETFEEKLSYWKERLGSEVPRLPLPNDRLSSRHQDSSAAALAIDIPDAIWAALRTFGHENGASLALVLLAVFKVLLYRYTGEGRIVIGVPTANRHVEAYANVVGRFENTVTVCTDLSDNPAFRVLLERVCANALKAREDRDLPVERLTQHLGDGEPSIQEPLHKIIFSLKPPQQVAGTLPAESWCALNVDDEVLACDLAFELCDAPGELGARLKYDAGLLDAATVARMVSHLEVLLESIAADPDARLADLPLLTEAEHRQLLEQWNDTTKYIQDKPLHRRFEDQVALQPDATAISLYGGEQVSYAELNARSNRIANAILRKGLMPGQPVAVMLEDGPKQIAALLGVLKAGGVLVCLDACYPTRRLSDILDEVRPSILLAGYACLEEHSMLMSKFEAFDAEILLTDGPSTEESQVRLPAKCEWLVSLDNGPENNPEVDVDPGDPAYIVYTSGSTGRPKGIMQSHRSFCQYIQWQSEQFGIGPGQRVAHWALVTYDASYREIFGTLCYGATLCMAAPGVRYNPTALVQWARDERITIFNVVPSFWRQVTEVLMAEDRRPDSRPLPDLRILLHPGEILPVDLVRRWLYDFPNPPKLFNLYGPSECVLATWYAVEAVSADQRSIPIGRAIDGRQILILDQDQKLCPIGVRGEIYVRSRYLTMGYYQRPEETEKKFIQNPLHDDYHDPVLRTGDTGYWLPDGTVEFSGRIDNMVKLRGMRVELGDIENVLRQHSGVRNCAAIVRRMEGTRERLVAKDRHARAAASTASEQRRLVAYFTADQQLSGDDLRSFLEERLPIHMIPQRLIQMDKLPLNANRKLDLRALPDPAHVRPLLKAEWIAPRTPLEKRLARIWEELLGVQGIGINDDFFELGGNSLLAMQVLNRLRHGAGGKLSFRDLFRARTIAGIAPLIETAEETEPSRPLASFRAETQATYPLSLAQQGIWFLSRLEPESPYYTGQGTIGLKGQLDLAALNDAWRALLHRHMILRTKFGTADGEPYQAFCDLPTTDLRLVDLSGRPQAEQTAFIARVAQRRAEQALDLESDSLLEATLFKLSATEHELLLTFHEIILDLWAISILLHDLGELYESFTAGQGPPLSSPRPRFIDFLLFEREQLQADKLLAQREYWQQALAGQLPVLRLPTDRPHPASPSYRGAAESVLLDARLSTALRDLAADEGATLFMTLLAAFNVLLHVYTGDEDVIVGAPIANRNHDGVEKVVGFFLNMLPLRAQLTRDQSFAALLRQVRENVAGAITNADYPFSWMLEWADAARDTRISPMFQVMFNMLNLPQASLDAGHLHITYNELDTGYSKYDLALYAQEHGDQIYLELAYLTDLFDGKTVERMLRNFVVLLSSVVENHEAPIGQLRVLAEAELQTLLAEVNTSASHFEYKHCIHQLFEQQAERSPERTAFIWREQQLSYAELNGRANQLARHLRHQGVAAETVVAVCANRSFDMIIGLMAVMKAGGTFVCLDPEYPLARLQDIVDDARPAVLLLHADLDRFESFQGRKIYLDRDLARFGREDASNLPCLTTPANLLSIVYTSSTTGKPKGVLIGMDAIVNRLFWMWQDYPFRAGDVALLHKSYALIASTWELFGALLKGVPTVILSLEDLRDPARFWREGTRNGVTHLLASPAILEVVLSQAEGHPPAWPALRFATTSTEQIPVIMLERWRRAFPGVPLFNLYGSTECSSNVTVYDTSALDVDALRVPVGRPIANVQVHILDEGLGLVPIGATGEMCVAGACLARGYLNLPDLTNDRFVPDPFSDDPDARLYRTGDLARRRADGNMELIGRVDNQVTIRGFRVELEDIEAVLSRHEAVKTCAVTLSGSAERAALLAFAMLDRDVPMTELRGFMQERLPSYMIPTDVIAVESLPLTPNGKVDRAALRARDPGPRDAGGTYLAPRTADERRLADLWADLLGFDRVGVRDNFFDLGGHSLLAVRLFHRIEKEFGASLSLALLYRTPTVEGLAPALLGRDVEWTALLPIRRGDATAPLFCVPGIHGDVEFCRNLARHLDRDQAVYALHPLTLSGEPSSHRSVESMAAHFIYLIRKAQPVGPYFLSGYSFGGTVALEIAQQMRAQGEDVALLTIFDSVAPQSHRWEEFDAEFLYGEERFIDDLASGRHVAWLTRCRLALRRNRTLFKAYMKLRRLEADLYGRWCEFYFARGRSLPAARRRKYTAWIGKQAGRNYIPKPFPGEIVLFCTKKRQPWIEPTWRGLAAGVLTIRKVPGVHVKLFDEPHVQVLAEQLQACIDERRESRRGATQGSGFDRALRCHDRTTEKQI